jgi:hypothetical protein
MILEKLVQDSAKSHRIYGLVQQNIAFILGVT